MNEKLKKVLFSALRIVGAIAFWVFIWFLIAKRIGLEIIFPSPLAVLKALKELIALPKFRTVVAASLLRVSYGILISLIVGCVLAYLISVSKILNALFTPMLSVMKATPIAAFIVIVWLWMHTSLLPILVTSLIVIPIITSNVSQGILSVDKDLKEVTKVYKFSIFKKLFRLYVPSVAPYFLAACKSALGMAWKASVSAELMVASKNSIGYEMLKEKQNFETAYVFAWTLVVIILSILLEKLTLALLNILGKKLKLLRKGGTNA